MSNTRGDRFTSVTSEDTNRLQYRPIYNHQLTTHNSKDIDPKKWLKKDGRPYYLQSEIDLVNLRLEYFDSLM